MLQRRAFPFLAVANFLVPLAFFPLFGWNAVLIAGAQRTAALMTATGFVNSVCHKWGSRATDSRGHQFRADDSRNNHPREETGTLSGLDHPGQPREGQSGRWIVVTPVRARGMPLVAPGAIPAPRPGPTQRTAG